MTRETSISIAVAHIKSKAKLLDIIDKLEKLSSIKIEREEIIRIWRDIRRVPKSWALGF